MIPSPFWKSLLVAFEGPNFCGKSTYLERVHVELGKLYNNRRNIPYHRVFITKEPNKDRYWGRRIYQELKRHDGLHITNPMGFQTWYAVDSKENVQSVILPNLRLGHIVLTDRFRPSMVHGAMKREDLIPLMRMHESVMGEYMIWPDIVFIFDVSVETALARLATKRVTPDVQETKGELERTIPMYRYFVEDFPHANCRIIDANNKTPEMITAEVMGILIPMIVVRGY